LTTTADRVPGQHQVTRSTLAILAGLLAIMLAVMVGVAAATVVFVPGGLASMRSAAAAAPSAAYLVANLAVSMGAAVLGGWLTARLAPRAALVHVVVLALVLLAMSVAPSLGGRGPAPGQPGWYAAAIAIVGVAGVLAGGWIRARR
jgi:hypothetical protein